MLVAGGAAGIGLACAELMAARGADLIICDVDGVALAETTQRLSAFGRFCDSIEEHSVAIFADELATRFGTLDVLINTAGKGYVRALAMMRMARACMPLLRAACGKRLLINVGPDGGIAANDDGFSYASSADAFERLSEALAEQVKGTSITVVSVAPILTPPSGGPATFATRSYGARRTDIRRTAEHVANLVDATLRCGCAKIPPQQSGPQSY